MIDTPDAHWTCARYAALRHLLPRADFPAASVHVPDLGAVMDRYDGFILDAFGVLNVGEGVIPGAVARIAQMRAAGKRVVVLTNGASYPRAAALAKYARLGFDFSPDEVVASRDLAGAELARHDPAMLWAGITAAGAAFDDLPARVLPLAGDDSLLRRADGFVFLGAEGWTPARQAALVAALRASPRPVIVANPDIVAPREGGFSLEPGHFAADLPGALTWVGKPHGPALQAAVARLGATPSDRIAMVGDTLHTDILGGRAAGLGTVLIAGHGLFRGLDPAPFIAGSGIVPDVIAQTT
jgi:glycerol-1-phosphatase